MSGLAGWVCLDLGKNMNHEVMFWGRRITMFFWRKKKKDLRFKKKKFSLFVF